MSRTRRATVLLLPLPAVLLAGCGSDRPYRNSEHQTPYGMSATRSASIAPASDSAAPDRPPDPLIGEHGQDMHDPLIGQDPLIGNDPLVASSPVVGHDPLAGHNSLQGAEMPTEHSHWIQCRLLHDAQVTVLLNGTRYKSYSGVVADDITMKLRRGVNTVTFVYQPLGTGAAADLAVVEGEHHPDIAPLATFHPPSGAAVSMAAPSKDDMKPVTQKFSIYAN